VLALAVVAVILFGFPTSKDEVTFKYTAFGGKDQIDQVLEIHNDGLHAITTRLQITPLDEFGYPIEDLKVTSAFGTEKGEHVLPSLYTEGDFLKFEGDRAAEVRKVRVKILDIDQVKYPEQAEPFTVTKYDDGGKVDKFAEEFDSVEISNPNEDDMTVKLVVIAWLDAKKGEPQQFDWAIPLDDKIEVPGKGKKMVPLPEDLTDISYVSVEAVQVTS
jgi:hypothetical protein